jgi:hypothetical protein
MKKVLLIAYAFPPMSYAGVFRTLRFCKYLPQFDWQPLILTIKENPYHNKDYSLMEQLPKNVKVYRTSTIDPAKWYSNRAQAKKSIIGSDGQEHTKGNLINNVFQKSNLIKRIKRFLFNFVSFPDHMIFWIPFALIGGIKILMKEKPDVIYTSSPPHSSHLIGLILSKLFRKPWVADFRDPWVDSDYLKQFLKSNIYMQISICLEALVVRNATRVLLNTDFNRDAVLQRYHSLDQGKLQTLTNGFDYDDVRGVVPQDNKKLTITFTGTFYSYFKTDLFLNGLKLWVEEAGLNNVLNRFQVLFVGGKNPEVEMMIKERNLSNIVRYISFVPKKKAMEICMASHVLLLMLGFNEGSKGILPSKIFDYFLCKKPILAIAPEGEVAKLVKESRTGHVISEDNPKLIAQVIDNEYKKFIEKGELDYLPDWSVIERYGAQFLNKRLATIFDEIEKD